jgi:hypothetical protein
LAELKRENAVLRSEVDECRLEVAEATSGGECKQGRREEKQTSARF